MIGPINNLVYSTNSIIQITHDSKAGLLHFGPAFNKTFLENVFELQQSIENIGQNEAEGLEKICYAPMISSTEKPDISQCVVQSLFGYFGNDMDAFKEVTIDDEGYTVNYLNKLNKCLVWV